jgi:hypothetical protein
MCEEFIPSLLENGYKCIIILRDPRDVLASANYPRGEKYLGDRKPTLFLLRTWRKSAEFAWALRNTPGFFHLRYEDLVTRPEASLERVAAFLGLDHTVRAPTRVRDRFGRPWTANSSGSINGAEISASAVGSYRHALSDDEVAYTEAVCGYEMDWLGYRRDAGTDAAGAITSFQDAPMDSASGLPGDFSHRPEQVARELERLEEFRACYK